jgi:mono/diheme cytochrome c family protein
VAPSEYRIPLPASYGPPVTTVPPPADNPVARGAYLAGPVAHCIECHSPMVNGHSDFSRTGAGGMQFPGPWGVSVARNITPHANGLGDWTDAEILRAVMQGVSRDGRQLAPPMAYAAYAQMTAQEQADLLAYLRSLPPQP